MNEEEEFEFRLRLEQEVPAKPLDPREYNPLSVKNLMGAAIEPGLAMGTSGLAAGIGGWGAIDSWLKNELIGRGMEGEITDPVATRDRAMEQYSYQPRTKGGQVATELLTQPFAKYAGMAKSMGDKAQGYTGSPVYGAATEAMLHALPMGLAPKAISGRPVLPKLNAAVGYLPKKAGQGVNAVKEAIMNRLPGGTDRAVTEIVRDTAGPRIKDLGTAIENAPQGLTGGQAGVPAKSTEFSALSKMAEEKLPSDYLAVKEAQQAARVKELETVAQSPQKQQFMKNIRKGVSDKLYDAARKGELPQENVNSIVSSINRTMKENPGNPKLLSELRKAKRGLVDSEGNVRTSAQEVMSTVDGLRATLDSLPKGSALSGQINSLKKDIAGLSAKYKQADKFYADTSRPITQMEIGQELIDTVKPRLGSQERASAYANAITTRGQELASKRAAGGRRPVKGEFKDKMTDPQMDVISKVGKELDNNADFKSQAMTGRKKMNEIVGTMWESPKVRILERVMVIFNTILKRIEGKNASATIERFAELNKPENRAELLKIIEKATPEEKAVLLEASKIRDKAIAAEMVAGALQTQQENNYMPINGKE